MNGENETPSFSALRRWGAWVNVFTAIGAALALVVMANYLSTRYYERSTWTPVSVIQLSSKTRLVLDSLTNDVQVIAFFDRSDPVYELVEEMLKAYRHASKKHLQIETVDYVRNPGRAVEIKQKYKLSQSDTDLVIFACEGHPPEVVHGSRLSEYDTSGLMSGATREVKRKAFKGEPLFTAAILKVSSTRQQKAFFLQGHREHDPANDKPMGYATFADMLRSLNVGVEKLSLAGTNTVPADCQLLIVAGALDPLSDDELEKINKYVTRGGRMLLLFTFQAKNRLEYLAENWGVQALQNVVVEPVETTSGMDVAVLHYGNHPIAKPLAQEQQRVQLVRPRSIARMNKSAPRADAPEVVELMFTTPEATAHAEVRNGEIHANSFRDYTGTIPLSVAVEVGKIPGVEQAGARLVVCGDSYFLDNQFLENIPANRIFAEQAVNWLLDNNQLIGGIGARATVTHNLVMTKGQLRSVSWILMGGLPGATLLVGLLVWWRRRH